MQKNISALDKILSVECGEYKSEQQMKVWDIIGRGEGVAAIVVATLKEKYISTK